MKSLNKTLVDLESKNLQLQQLLRDITLEYTKKGLQWTGKTLDDIF